MASGVRVMEKRVPHQQEQHQQEALKCPRCESSNTKFCYYNNYSLSQPRHFCKACKRYWTRGGTLRNVPVGGGCRKNKRVKRPTTTTAAHVSAPSAPVDHHNTNHKPNPNPTLDHLPDSTASNNNSNHHVNPLFYGLLPQNPNYPLFDTRVSRYDLLQPHTNALGQRFSSSGQGSPFVVNNAQNSSSLFSNPSSIFAGASSSTSTSAPTMASLLASSLHQQQRFMGFATYDERCSSVVNDLKMEETQNRIEWNHNFHGQNSIDQIEAVSSDPNSLLWETTPGGGGGWIDPTNNFCSSVPSLI